VGGEEGLWPGHVRGGHGEGGAVLARPALLPCCSRTSRRPRFHNPCVPACAVNFQELAADLAQITFDYPFRIPPYFALIIRAIGVLEGGCGLEGLWLCG
jgi:hypothetical protein